jgi:hypothetical protein
MVTADRLLEELEGCRWFVMRQLADEAEERGDAELAAGWRWLAQRRKWPAANALNSPDPYLWRFKHGSAAGQPSSLPESVFPFLAGEDAPARERAMNESGYILDRRQSWQVRSASEGELLTDTARAVGRWLAAGHVH